MLSNLKYWLSGILLGLSVSGFDSLNWRQAMNIGTWDAPFNLFHLSLADASSLFILVTLGAVALCFPLTKLWNELPHFQLNREDDEEL